MPLTADEIDALDVGEVAPASRQRTLTADEIDSIEPAPQIGAGRQAFSRFARAALGGVAGTLEAIPIAATALASKFGDPLLSETEERDVTSRPLYRAGQAIRRAAENAYPVDQNRPKSFLVDTLPQGAGSMAAFIAGGAAGKVAGASTWATVGALGGGVSGAEAFDEATKSGANDEDAFKVFAINAGLGTTEAVPIAGWLNRLNKASGNKLKRAIIEGSEEAAQEVFQQVGGNLTAQKYYDPDRKLFEGAGEGGAAGFTLGSLMSLVVSAIGGRRARVPETRIQTVTDDRGLSRFAPVKEEAEAKAPAVRTAAVLAQAQPIEPEVARQKLWVIMQDEEMDIPLDQWQQPASPHLKLVLGDNAPSWRDLNFSGVVTANKNPNGTYRVKVIPRTTEQTLPVATETGIADELNRLRAISNPTAEQQARIAQIEAQDKGKVQRAAWEAQMKADLEARKAASSKNAALLQQHGFKLDENGDIIAWHGTDQPIQGDQFTASDRKGVSFSSSPEDAANYGWEAAKRNSQNPDRSDVQVYEVRLRPRAVGEVQYNREGIGERPAGNYDAFVTSQQAGDMEVTDPSIVRIVETKKPFSKPSPNAPIKDTGAAAVPQTDVSGELPAVVKPVAPVVKESFTSPVAPKAEATPATPVSETSGKGLQNANTRTTGSKSVRPNVSGSGVGERLRAGTGTQQGQPAAANLPREVGGGVIAGEGGQQAKLRSDAGAATGIEVGDDVTIPDPTRPQKRLTATVTRIEQLPNDAEPMVDLNFSGREVKRKPISQVEFKKKGMIRQNREDAAKLREKIAAEKQPTPAAAPAQKKTAPASDVAPKQSETKPITIDAALNLAEQRKAEGKSQLSVTRELGEAGLSDGDATGIAGQVFEKAKAITPEMSVAQKEEILGNEVRQRILDAPSFPKLLAAARAFQKSLHRTLAPGWEAKQQAEPWDLLSAHSGVMNAKSARAKTLQSLANAVILEANLPMQKPGRYRGMEYRIDWDKLNEQQPALSIAPTQTPETPTDLFPDLKGKAPTLERVRNAIVEAEADLSAKTETANDENIRLDHPIHVEVDLAQKRVDKLRALGQRLEQTAISKTESPPDTAGGESPALETETTAADSKASNPDQVASRQAMESANGSAFDALTKLHREHEFKNPLLKELLGQLLAFGERGVKIEVGGVPTESQTRRTNSAGLYDHKTDTIHVFDAAFTHGMSVRAAVHEYVHALTTNALTDGKFQERLEELFRAAAVKAYREGFRFYGLQQSGFMPGAIPNLREFIAEAMTNKKFQEFLNRTRSPIKGVASLWQQFVDLLARTFGVKNSSVLADVIRITGELVKDNNRERPVGVDAPSVEMLVETPTGDARAREEEGEKAITQVQSVKVGVEREAENIAAIQQTIRADIFDGTQPVSASATAQARELLLRLTDPAGKAAAAGEILTKTNAQMGPGLVLAELWRYAERTVLATGDDSLLRQIVPHYQDFPLGESGAGSTAFGRGLRALQETDTLFKQLYEIEKGKRTAAGEQMSVGPELLEALLAGLKGEVPDATVLERKTRTVLGTKVPQNKVEEIVRVVRANIVDPITALVDHFSKMAGFPAVTPEQHEQLIKLAQQLSDPNLSIPEKSELIDQMFEVFNRLKLPPSLLTRLAANLVATNLTGFKTLGINIFSPTVQGLVDLGLTGITSPRDFPAMLKGAIDGGKQWLANIRYSMGRDAYSFLSNDYQAAQNVLKQMWQRGLQQIKSNSWSERSRGLANLIFGLQQYYMRLLNAVDNANGILRRQMQMSLYSSQAMRRFGMNSQEIRDVTEMFYLMRDQFYAQAVEMGLTENQSRIRASALAYQEFVDFLNNELPTDSAGRPIGSEIAKAAHHEAMSVLGRLSEGVNEIDEGGLVKRTVGAPILYLSNWMRQQEGLMPAIGVSLLGYVNVPYRTASYYAWNTPYGLVRLGIHKWRKSKKKESWWKQSLATEFQEQQRLKNALAGSAVLAALTGIGIGLLNTSAGDDAGDDDDNSVYFTGNGPKNKNLRSAWIAKGFRPQSLVVFVGGKPVVMELSRSGESLAHYAWLLAARDDRAWREKEAKATNRKYAPTPSKEAAYAIGTYLGLLGQRGFLQTVTQAGNVASGQADPLAFAASKGGSFVSGLFTPGLGLQRSVQGLLHGPVDASSVQSAFLANFPMLSITGINHPKVNAFGDPLYNPENSWYHKMKETGIPIAFSTSPTTENKQLYGLMVEKGVAPRELRRSTVENKYGPLTDAEFSQFAQKSGKLLKEQTVNNLPMLQNMTQEGVKKWLNSATASADRVTAMGMNLEPVKPQAVSSGASSALPTAPATGLTRRSGVPTGSIAGPRRTGLARLAASRVGGRSRIARPRFASLRGLGRPTRRRRSIVGRLGRVRRPRGLSMRGLRRPRMPRPRRLRRRLTLV